MSDERVTLRDGVQVVVRRVRPDDADLLADGFARLSRASRRLRFLSAKAQLTPQELHYLTHVDGINHEAIGALDPITGAGVGIGRFVRDPTDPHSAEVAVAVADAWQRRGIATVLLERLADHAREQDIARFTALVASDNAAIREMVGQLFTKTSLTTSADGTAELVIELEPSDAGAALFRVLRAVASGQLPLAPELQRALRALFPMRF